MSARAAARSTPAYRRAVEELRPNPGQWQAYNADRHCVVLAGPGSGKTKTLTVKIAKLLIETVREPRGLACLTYNAECARELKTRLDRLGILESDNVFIGTVHSFCFKKVVIPYAGLGGIQLPADLRIALPSEQEALFARAVALEISADEPPWRWRTLTEEYRRTHSRPDEACLLRAPRHEGHAHRNPWDERGLGSRDEVLVEAFDGLG
jgi:superfamily I DNA/RNA helicase